MGFFSKLFGKKNKAGLGEDDGQAQYFKEDFEPVTQKTSTKKESVSSAPKKAESINKPKEAKSTAKPSATAKATEKKPATTKSSETKAVSKSSAPAKASEKKTATKTKTEKPKVAEINDDSPEVKGAATVQESKATANGKWDIRRAKDGRFFFSLYASNHTVIAYSQIYSSVTAVTTGINSVITNAGKAEIEDTTLKNPTSLPCPKWEIYIDKAEQYRFRLYATNGQIVCHSSHGYASKSGCKGGIDSIRRFCAEAKVDKSYLK